MMYIHALYMAVLLCSTSAVQGQDRDASGDYSNLILEEIIVTAEKRGEQNVLDVAMSISAISGDEMRKRNLQGPKATLL